MEVMKKTLMVAAKLRGRWPRGYLAAPGRGANGPRIRLAAARTRTELQRISEQQTNANYQRPVWPGLDTPGSEVR